jgi:tetratricopeptide (TPR) repeat protein
MTDMLADARQAHRLTGGHPTAYYLQAVLAARARNFELAKLIYNRTRGALSEVPAAMLLESAIDFETGNVEQASRRLVRLIDRQPGNRRARRLLAAAQYRMGDFAAVIETLVPIADAPDADPYSLALIGRALARSGDPRSASLYLARIARRPGDLPISLDPLSEEVFADLRRDAAADPGHGPTQVRLVSALLARGLGEEALVHAQRLQASQPGAPEAHILLGDAFGISGDYAAAAEQYRRAANLAFTESVAMRLIEALRRSGRTDAAVQVLETFARQNPRNLNAQFLLASQAMGARDWDRAIERYEGLRQRLGNNEATILNNLAWAYSESGDYRAAIPLARRAWILDRNNPATTDTLGWILFKSGMDRPGGLALLERAARGAPSDVEIQRRLVEARSG